MIVLFITTNIQLKLYILEKANIFLASVALHLNNKEIIIFPKILTITSWKVWKLLVRKTGKSFWIVERKKNLTHPLYIKISKYQWKKGNLPIFINILVVIITSKDGKLIKLLAITPPKKKADPILCTIKYWIIISYFLYFSNNIMKTNTIIFSSKKTQQENKDLHDSPKIHDLKNTSEKLK